MCVLSPHCSTLSCQLHLLPALTSPRVNASYVRRHIIECIPPSTGPHLTAPAYQSQQTMERANLWLYRGRLLLRTSRLMYVMSDGGDRQRKEIWCFCRLPSFCDVLFSSAVVCLDVPLSALCTEYFITALRVLTLANAKGHQRLNVHAEKGRPACCSGRTFSWRVRASHVGANEAATEPRRRPGKP